MVFFVLRVSLWCGVESLSFRGGAAGGGDIIYVCVYVIGCGCMIWICRVKTW